jgi:hypothetical protein
MVLADRSRVAIDGLGRGPTMGSGTSWGAVTDIAEAQS